MLFNGFLQFRQIFSTPTIDKELNKGLEVLCGIKNGIIFDPTS